MRRCLIALLLLAGVAAAQAQTYPSRALRIVTPFAAGAVSDISFRILADKLSARLNVPVIMENQPGGGGIAAARTVMTSPPDGYTLALLSNATAISVGLFKNLTFDPRTDFVPVAGVSDFEYLFVTNAESKYRTLPDFIETARKNPGKLNVGTANAGTSNHLTTLLFKSTLNLDFLVVPHRGPSELTVALYRNDLDMVVNAYGGLRQGIDEGKIRVLAVTSPARSAVLPEVPTAQEAGVAGFEVLTWNGLYAPAGTPKEAVALLEREVQAVLVEPDVVKRFLDLSVQARPTSAEALDQRMRSEIERWTKVINDAGIERR
jgi:tripartite-type tricarboxylate transporter receptor subunit TctC